MRLINNIQSLPIQCSDDLVASWIDEMRSKGRARAMLPLLRHDHPVYDQRSTNTVIRIRGYLMASFEQTGLPSGAVKDLLEELDNTDSPYLAAAAAIGLRGVRKPVPYYLSALLDAIRRFQYGDDSVCFKVFKPDWQKQQGRSALTELLLTVEEFSDRITISKKELQELDKEIRLSAENLLIWNRIIKVQEQYSKSDKVSDDCCNLPVKRHGKFLSAVYSFSKIRVQDQDGHFHMLSDLMNDRPSLIAFFYTRCHNVYRCSLTISRLGWLQEGLRNAGIESEVQILAISYDSTYDLPYRLKAFAEHRGFKSDENAKCVRVESGMDQLLGCLQPGVNFNDGLINHHAVTYFLFDRFGFLKKRISGTQWSQQQLIDTLITLRHQKSTYINQVRNATKAGLSIVYSVIIAFFPKCPLCAAAYLSALGISSAGLTRYHRLLLPVLLLLLGWHLHSVARRAWRRNWYLPLVFSVFGSICVAWSAFGTPDIWWNYAGIVLIGIGSLLNSWERTAKKNSKIINMAGRNLPSLLFQKRQF